jgi:hypothetical protein
LLVESIWSSQLATVAAATDNGDRSVRASGLLLCALRVKRNAQARDRLTCHHCGDEQGRLHNHKWAFTMGLGQWSGSMVSVLGTRLLFACLWHISGIELYLVRNRILSIKAGFGGPRRIMQNGPTLALHVKQGTRSHALATNAKSPVQYSPTVYLLITPRYHCDQISKWGTRIFLGQ